MNSDCDLCDRGYGRLGVKAYWGRLRFVILMLIPFVLPVFVCASASENESVDETMAWLSTLGLPNTNGAPFVRVFTGGKIITTTGQDQGSRELAIYGFELQKQGSRVQVLTSGLNQIARREASEHDYR